MAAKAKNAEIFSEDQTQDYNVKTSVNCANCALMEQQLHSALLELKSAEAIISLLREDIKNTTHVPTADLQPPAPSQETSECETNGCEQTSEKWTSIVCKNNKMKVTCATNTMNIQQFVSENRFAPLLTLTKNLYSCANATGLSLHNSQ